MSVSPDSNLKSWSFYNRPSSHSSSPISDLSNENDDHDKSINDGNNDLNDNKKKRKSFDDITNNNDNNGNNDNNVNVKPNKISKLDDNQPPHTIATLKFSQKKPFEEESPFWSNNKTQHRKYDHPISSNPSLSHKLQNIADTINKEDEIEINKPVKLNNTEDELNKFNKIEDYLSKQRGEILKNPIFSDNKEETMERLHTVEELKEASWLNYNKKQEYLNGKKNENGIEENGNYDDGMEDDYDDENEYENEEDNESASDDDYDKENNIDVMQKSINSGNVQDYFEPEYNSHASDINNDSISKLKGCIRSLQIGSLDALMESCKDSHEYLDANSWPLKRLANIIGEHSRWLETFKEVIEHKKHNQSLL